MGITWMNEYWIIWMLNDVYLLNITKPRSVIYDHILQNIFGNMKFLSLGNSHHKPNLFYDAKLMKRRQNQNHKIMRIRLINQILESRTFWNNSQITCWSPVTKKVFHQNDQIALNCLIGPLSQIRIKWSKELLHVPFNFEFFIPFDISKCVE